MSRFRPVVLTAAVVSAALLTTGAFVFGFGSVARGAHHEKAEEPPQIQHGRELFLENCASCHGAGAKGDGPMAADLKAPPANLTTIAARRGGEFNAAEIREIVEGRKALKSHGSREMPVWGNEFARKRKKGEGREGATRTRVHALVSYLESIQVPQR